MTQTSDSCINTTGQFLIAMPGLNDPFFSGTVIYMLDHTEEGATGLIVNRPLDVTENEVLDQFAKDQPHAQIDNQVLSGGPVESQRGFVLHPPGERTWAHEIALTDQLHCTLSADILEAVAEGQNIGKHMIILGYAGWDAGQLEQEIADNAWLLAPASESILFNTQVEKRLDAALAGLGIHYHSLSSESGHA